MAILKTMDQAAKEAGQFYVPQFQILACASKNSKGEPLPAAVLHDVVEITYKDKLEEIDSCEIVVNNWDATHHCFKYIGAEDLDPSGQPSQEAAKRNDPNAKLWNLFDPCTRQVELRLGYAPGPLERMMIGAFVTYEPNFPASGPPVLAVRMLNLMSKLRAKRVDAQYTPDTVKPRKLTDSAIADYIDKKQRLPLPIKTDLNAMDSEPSRTYVVQKNQYDVDFLWQRARLNGYDLRLDVDTDGQLKLFFMKSTAPEQPVYQLAWGQSLIDFKPTLTTGNQFKSVTVRGWDRATQKPINITLDLTSDEIKKINGNLHYLLAQCDPREENVVDQPFDSIAQARQHAIGVFSDQLKRVVKATGTTIGLPKLRAGSRVEIGRIGSRLSGTYFVTATTHTFNSNGYITRFEARREDQGTAR